MELVKKNKYSLKDFLNLVELLRSPKGCPWERVQTHSSIRSSLIEEAYDAVEAIDLSDSDMLKEELGDLLLQIALHASIEENYYYFNFDDVVDGICRKIILKHPHLFSDLKRKNEDNNDGYPPRIKNNSRNFKVHSMSDSPIDSMRSVSKILPSLMRTTKIQRRAARSGYGVFSVEDALEETFERLEYLETLISQGKQEEYFRELGGLLFSITEVARLIGVDPESALYDSCERFKDEFLYKISLENHNKM